MKKSDHISTTIPAQRQPLGAIIYLAAESFKGIVLQFWPVLLIGLLNRSKSGRNYWFIIGGAGIAALSFVLSVIGYFRFTYAVKNREIIIDQGIFTRRRTNVPFDRVQSINFEQKVLHRLLNLVSFRIDTAGSEQSEITIPAMKLTDAQELRELILSNRRVVKSPDSEEALVTSDDQTGSNIIFSLSIPDLIKVGVSVNHIRTMGIILALMWGIYSETSDVFDDVIENLENAEQIANSSRESWMYFAVAVPVLFIISFLASLVLTTLRFYNLRVFQIPDGLKVVAGLLNRKEQTARLKKTQVMTWVTNPIRRIFKMFNVRLKQASSSQVNAQQAISVPGCYEDQVGKLQTYYFGKYVDKPFTTFGIRKEIILRYTLYFGLLPIIPLGVLIYFNEYEIPFYLLAWLPFSYWMFRTYYKKWKIHLNDDLLLTERGIFGRRFDMMFLYKVQSVSIKQTPYQSRKKLANLHIQTASGRIVIPYLYRDFAEQLMDMLLYKIESSKKSWM